MSLLGNEQLRTPDGAPYQKAPSECSEGLARSEPATADAPTSPYARESERVSAYILRASVP